MTKEESQFYAGAIWAASTIYRMHSDSVVAKDFLREINDLDVAAKCGAEYDVRSPITPVCFARFTIGPMMRIYEAISFGPVNNTAISSAITLRLRSPYLRPASVWGLCSAVRVSRI